MGPDFFTGKEKKETLLKKKNTEHEMVEGGKCSPCRETNQQTVNI